MQASLAKEHESLQEKIACPNDNVIWKTIIMKRNIYLIIILFSIFPTLSIAQTDRQMIRQGNRQYRTEQYEKAEGTYRKAVSANQKNPEALYNLGCALMAQQKDSLAVQCFENSAKLQSEPLRRAQAYHNIGVICQQKKLFKKAVEAYKESLRNNPKDNETRYNLALCMKQMKDQPQKQDGNGNDQKDQKKEQKDNKDQQKQKKKEQQQDQQQQEEKMSKDNAEQLLNAAIQQEKSTMERLKKDQKKPRQSRHQKNW